MSLWELLSDIARMVLIYQVRRISKASPTLYPRAWTTCLAILTRLLICGIASNVRAPIFPTNVLSPPGGTKCCFVGVGKQPALSGFRDLYCKIDRTFDDDLAGAEHTCWE
jgi:hypothetical protein